MKKLLILGLSLIAGLVLAGGSISVVNDTALGSYRRSTITWTCSSGGVGATNVGYFNGELCQVQWTATAGTCTNYFKDSLGNDYFNGNGIVGASIVAPTIPGSPNTTNGFKRCMADQFTFTATNCTAGTTGSVVIIWKP